MAPTSRRSAALLAADRNVGEGVVRDHLPLDLKLGLQGEEVRVQRRELVLEVLPLLDERGAFFGLHLTLHPLGVGVAALADLVRLAVQRLIPVVRVHDPRDVARRGALVRVRLDGLGVLLHGLEVDRRFPRERRGGGRDGGLGLLHRRGGDERAATGEGGAARGRARGCLGGCGRDGRRGESGRVRGRVGEGRVRDRSEEDKEGTGAPERVLFRRESTRVVPRGGARARRRGANPRADAGRDPRDERRERMRPPTTAARLAAGSRAC